MSSFRRHCSVNNDDIPYIKDGLVFWLDGINKGNNKGYWTDLINNIKFLLGNKTVINKDNIYCNSEPLYPDNNYADKNIYDIIEWNENNFTIEIVINTNYSGTNNNYIFIAGNKTLSICIAEHKATTIYDGSIRHACYPINWKIMSATKNYCIQNFVEVYPVINDYWNSNTNTMSIKAFKCNIYSIRLYNRQLTKQEILHNQEIDNKRFNLGL